MKFKPILFTLIIVAILTLLTQIGGVIYLTIVLATSRIKHKKKLFTPLISLCAYLISTFLIIPPIAQKFGRVPLPISKSSSLAPQTYLTVILNRHYVTPALKEELIQIASSFEASNKGIKTIYLDANFPFWNGFPLLPHLSHNDGRKVDLSFIYSKNGQLTNAKPSNSGYGHFEHPKSNEYSFPKKCAAGGQWQYSMAQYLTLGSSDDLDFEAQYTKALIMQILNRPRTQKVFIEPHLSERMHIKHSKLRYHGCHSVRHDDHIHLQIN